MVYSVAFAFWLNEIMTIPHQTGAPILLGANGAAAQWSSANKCWIPIIAPAT